MHWFAVIEKLVNDTQNNSAHVNDFFNEYGNCSHALSGNQSFIKVL